LAAITEDVREAIGPQATTESITHIFRAQGVLSLMEDGLRKVNEGLTTMDEIWRVTQEDR
jgi:type II secretory ATPase GspE/PulE/Tfp pilus assembly ATPase PilB-like protein